MERFWSKVEKSNGCWNWLGSKLKRGYGLLKVGGTRKNILAHRYSYQLSNGEIPDGFMVCHSCDNPSCVNPEHLFLGTAQENSNDMVVKGRHVAAPKCGESNGRSKLGKDEALLIKSGLIKQSAAKSLFGISKSQFYRIRSNEQWRTT